MKIFFTVFLILTLMIVNANAEPYILDPNFVIKEYVSGLNFPTSMHFIDEDIMVLEKAGKVRLVKNGILQEEPIRHFNVNSLGEAGLLGITTNGSKVFLYMTEAKTAGGEPIANRIYKFDWDGKNLQNDVLVNELPVNPVRLQHNSGVMVTSSKGEVFAVTGDTHREGILQNFGTGEIDDTGIIFRVGLEEDIIKPSQSKDPLSHYYAMGIRNSFGLTIDPKTGNIWDTENGLTTFDEVNFVPPKFNSGWKKIMGPATDDQKKSLPSFYDYEYSDPEFSWEQVIAPTGLTFIDSDLFDYYKSSLFTADFLTGSIYKFKLNEQRNGFVFDDERLSDLVLNVDDPRHEIVFASGFRGITDLEFGPDGLLYILSPSGKIYTISPVPGIEESSEMNIPDWFKNNGKWWHEGSIGDEEFVNGLEFLIYQKIIDLEKIPHSLIDTLDEIPSWVKTNAGRWANDELNNEGFFPSVQFLIDKNFLKIDKPHCDDIPSFGVDFSGCDLTGVDFSNTDLRAADLRETNLSNSNLFKTDLRSARMENAIINNAKISNSNLQFANLNGVNFEFSDLSNTNLKYVQLERAILVGADLSNSDLSRSNLRYASFSGANLTNTNFFYVNLENAILTGSTLKNSHFHNAHLNNVNLENSDLSNSKFFLSFLEHAQLNGANLSHSNIEKTRFDNADLSNVNLVEADLNLVHFINSNLSGANLTGATLKSVQLIGTDLSNAILSGANLEDVRIKNVNFTGAKMDGCKGCP